MLIRSQDKRTLVVLSNAVNIMVQPDNQIVALYSFEHDCDALGDYSTESKAIKVLDMIQENYMNLDSLYHGFGLTDDCTSVFQMPQDSEVSEE